MPEEKKRKSFVLGEALAYPAQTTSKAKKPAKRNYNFPKPVYNKW